MLELNMLNVAMLLAMLIVGHILGWVLRGRRAKNEKAAVHSGWQDQIEAQRTEHDRLTNQNKVLMEQISQYQASNKDAKHRAKELSEAAQQAFSRRDELQREIKEIRSSLEVAVDEKRKLQTDKVANAGAADELAAAADKLAARNARIAKLENEVRNWQSRLPPLIDSFRKKKQEVDELSAELEAANLRIELLESNSQEHHTRIEPVHDPDTLTNGREASNDSELRDRLQHIKGVGPAIEKTLNELGIFRFHQIADMTEYDIDRVANRLRGFRSRIYREDWIGQARELRDGKASG